jgi:hypothetical protein
MEITLEQLIGLLDQQKEIVIEKLMNTSSYWNGDSTADHRKSVSIDSGNFLESGRKTRYPNDVEVLLRYKIE